ncbi:unnamed protein product [Calypogeia fissa]
MLIVAKDKSEIVKLKAQLSFEFSMKDLGPSKRILGMEIHRDRQKGKLWLTQGQYTKKVLAKFNMAGAKAVSTPLAPHFKLSAAFCPTDLVEKGLMSKVPYDNAVGSLIYLMVYTKLDILHVVGLVSRYMANPGKSATEAEYVATAEATKEAIWLNKLVKDLRILQSSMDLHCDSNSALHIATNRMTHGRVKHIDIRYHFIRQAVSDKQIELIKIEGKLNPTDMLTKVIPLESFSRHCAKLQILHM